MREDAVLRKGFNALDGLSIQLVGNGNEFVVAVVRSALNNTFPMPVPNP